MARPYPAHYTCLSGIDRHASLELKGSMPTKALRRGKYFPSVVARQSMKEGGSGGVKTPWEEAAN